MKSLPINPLAPCTEKEIAPTDSPLSKRESTNSTERQTRDSGNQSNDHRLRPGFTNRGERVDRDQPGEQPVCRIVASGFAVAEF